MTMNQSDRLSSIEHRLGRIEDKLDGIMAKVSELITRDDKLAVEREGVQAALRSSPFGSILTEIEKNGG